MVVERINTILRRRAADKAEREAKDLRKQSEAERKTHEARAKNLAHEAEQLRRARDINKKVITESGVIRDLAAIKGQLLTGQKSELLVSLDKGEVTLVRGKGFRIKDGHIELSRRTIFSGEPDFKSIRVKVDPATTQLTVGGWEDHVVEPGHWKDKPLVQDCIAQAYLDPRRNFENLRKQNRELNEYMEEAARHLP